MSVLSVTCCSLLSAVCAFTLVSAAGCGTDAKGVDDCRDIEEARCAAAKNCGIITDVPSCQRYYRDQCLHGLSVASPGAAKVKDCVAIIRAAGVCAAAGDTPLSDCDPVISSAPGLANACDIVNQPEKTTECEFLAPGADAGTSGSGGKSGTAGSGNTGGDAGAGAGGT